MKKGLFVTVEGPEGSGKTTAIERMKQELEKRNISFMVTREPGGIDIAEQIRSVILNVNNTAMDPRTEALLYAAARRQHLVEKVIPALEEGKLVLCDRFVHSSLAYQGYARGIGVENVWKINEFAIDGCMPDAILYFDLDPIIGMERIAKNKEREINRLDQEEMEFHQKVRNAYLDMANKDPKIHLIQAEKSREKVFEEAITILDSIIK